VKTEIQYGPAFAAAKVTLDQGEGIKAEAGAMLAMSSTITLETSTQGGIVKGLRRAVLGQESFFMNTFTAQAPDSQIHLAPSLPGDMVAWTLQGQSLFVQSGSYVASAIGVDVDTSWGGAKTFFSREGLFVLKVGGHGDVILASYGALHTVELQPGQTLTVDTGHMVAWSDTVSYSVRKVGGWKSTILSGEGLVCDLTGPGMIYLQTRSQDAFLDWLIPKLPKPSSN
jgi:uncharacterized protein (TIGR00266 family)